MQTASGPETLAVFEPSLLAVFSLRDRLEEESVNKCMPARVVQAEHWSKAARALIRPPAEPTLNSAAEIMFLSMFQNHRSCRGKTTMRRLMACILCLVLVDAAYSAVVLDAEPKETQKPYSPAMGQTVAVNPPPFIWIPAPTASEYSLQISADRSFPKDGTKTFRGIQLNVFVPGKPLEPGEWFWRYGVKTDDGYEYGKARPFNVAKGTREFPFPDFAEVLKRVPKEHPRVILTGEHLERVRRLAKGDLKSGVDSLIRLAKSHVGEVLVAEPPKPTSGPEMVNVMRTTRGPMDVMETCALAYLLTGEKGLGLEAKRRILHFFSWDPNGSTGLWSYDEPAMWVMMRGTRAYDWTYDLFTPEERAKVEPVMKQRAEQFYIHLKKKRKFHTSPYESHAGRMPGFLGEAAISFAHEWPEAREWIEYATLLYYTSYPAWGGDDGGWQEGPGYWSAYMSFAMHYVIALKNATGVDLMNKPFFRNTPYYALYTATPYHEHRPYGDGANSSPSALGSIVHAFSGALKDPYLKWYWQACGRDAGRDLLTLVTADPSIEPRNPKELPSSRLFEAVGLSAFHTALGDKENDITFLFRSSPFGSVSHGHADQNAFVLEAFGEALAPVTGYYPWYGSPHHQNWTRDTKAVNSILVDGEGQVKRKWSAQGEIAAFHSSEGYDYVEGEAAPAYGDRLERFRRHVVHARPGVFVIYDDLAARKPSTYQWLLHAFDKMEISGNRISLRRHKASMDAVVLLPKDAYLSQNDRYDPVPEAIGSQPANYKNSWHLTASTSEQELTGRFLTVLMVQKTGKEARFPNVKLLEGKGCVGVELTYPGGTNETIAFRAEPDGRIDCAQLQSDARVAAIARDGNGKEVRKLQIP